MPKKKVYCNHCKWIGTKYGLPMKYHVCKFSKVQVVRKIKNEDYYSPATEVVENVYPDCKEKNKNNDCINFEQEDY